MRVSEKRERSATRGWGPFSGGQLTVIIVAVVVTVLFPVGAWALSGSNLFVTDPGSGARATVNAAGALTVNEASPKTFYANAVLPSQIGIGNYTPLATPTPGHALVITSVVIDILKVVTPDQTVHVDIAISKGDASCQQVVLYHNGFYPLLLLSPSNRGATAFPFQPGIPIPAGRALCVDQGDTNNLLSEDSVSGYTVPASATLPGQ
jgi:hypothetical protein